MKDLRILLSGFGGQGILFLGKVVAAAALIAGKEVTWLPSYGPETRGGACRCSVCISDKPIGSPLVPNPDALVAMNQASCRLYIGDVRPGGLALVDSSMAADIPVRGDIQTVPLPATQLAAGAGLAGFANMIMLGRLFRKLRFCKLAALRDGLQKCIPPRKAGMLDANLRALKIGLDASF